VGARTYFILGWGFAMGTVFASHWSSLVSGGCAVGAALGFGAAGISGVGDLGPEGSNKTLLSATVGAMGVLCLVFAVAEFRSG
jgi:hypothetical protein